MHSLFRRAKAPAPMPMPMLSFPGKKALRFTGDTSAAERDVDLAVLMHARSHVVLASECAKASAAETAAALRAYLRIIYASQMMGGSMQQMLRFAWRDAGSGKKKAKASASAAAAGQGQGHTSLSTEWAVALFALAAELARAAAEEDRRGSDGIRRACTALCDAAGALRAAAARSALPSDRLCHMTDACLAAFERLMLAQALECYFELAFAGGKPPALCSKIARQVSLDYVEVSVALASLQQQQAIDRSWAPHAQAKAAYFHAEACLLRARALREQGPGVAGEAVARLRLAVSVLEAAGKGPLKKSSSSSAAPAAVRDAAARLRREVDAELAAVEADNCQVYCERVPAADALADLPGLPEPLVRPTAVERVLREADGEAALASGGAPTIRH
ncbi:vacuolar-sorting protein BRO1-like [Phragmites australis]|uniref:vacuolar-sorting protein BRO1-like n=1 Tax=Phragmites australis TaxID=29695 RepID=UPI002D79C49B|nr:vacuolar-sorting protein BRO1-like [Phragmites australis]